LESVKTIIIIFIDEAEAKQPLGFASDETSRFMTAITILSMHLFAVATGHW